MNETNDRSSPIRRRAVLGALAAGGTVALAGCGGGAGGGETLPPPVAGDPEAGVTLAVYEDFACPHCARYNEEGFPGFESAYIEPGEIRYEHHDLPIPVANPGSWEAANAARAVQDRAGDEAFYAFAARVFANYTQIPDAGPSLYESVADDLGLDGVAVRSAAIDRDYQATVEADRQAGDDTGVSSTPTFVLDGEIVAAGWSESVYSTVTDAIDRALGTTA